MPEYDKTNSGVLFKNDKKTTDKHPDYRGEINVDGQEFWLSSWIKTGNKGKFMTLAVTPKEAKPAARSAPPKPKPRIEQAEDDDQIPF